MIKFKQFTLQGDVLYKKKTVVPLSTPGLVYLMGLNHDGVSSGSGGALSNGTGKTRLAQLLEGYIYGYTARGRFKKMVGPDFIGDLEFMDRTGINWSFGYDSSENLWSVKANGVPKQVSHKASDCQAYLQSLLQLTRDDWNYFVYIDQTSIRTLLKGKPAERRAYLEDFFNIDEFYAEKKDEYDRLASDLEDRMALLQEDKVRYEQAIETLKKLPGDEWLETQLELIDLTVPWVKEKLTAISGQRDGLREKIAAWEEYQTLHAELSLMGAVPKGASLQEETTRLYAERAEVQAAITAKAQLDTLITRELTPHEQKKPESPGEAPEGEEPSGDVLTEKGERITQMRDKLKLKRKITDLDAELDGVEAEDEDEINESLKTDQAKLAELKYHHSLLSKSVDGGNCPTCGQTLPMLQEGQSPQDLKKSLEAEIKKVTGNIEISRLCLSKNQTLFAKIARLEEYKQTFAAYPNFGVKLSDAEDELEELKGLAGAWRTWRVVNKSIEQWTLRHKEILARAKALGYPSRLEEDRGEELKALDAKIELLTGQVKKVTRFEALTKVLVDQADKATLEKKLARLDGQKSEWEQRIESLAGLKGEFTEKQKQVWELFDQSNILEDALEEYESLQKEYRILEGISKFFAPKGFKIYELKKRCGLLIEKANYWSTSFFQEPYVWSMPEELDDLDFLVTPLNSPDTEPYSCSLLSGGETNRASRVLLFSQLQLIPPNKSTNLLILDEIEANLDAAGMLAFTETVIPKLKETFADKTIVLISHQTQMKTLGAIDHVWFAERRNRETALKLYPFYSRRRFSGEGEQAA